MTSKELAKLLGVSAATVSMAINGKPGVNERTRKRVLEAAKHYGILSEKQEDKKVKKQISLLVYEPNMIRHVDETFVNSIMGGIEEAAKEQDYRVLIMKAGTVDELLQMLKKASVDADTSGIILSCNELTQTDIDRMPNYRKPIVLLDNFDTNMVYHSVQIDNVSGAFEATNFMIKRSHTIPGYIRGKNQINNFVQRFRGYHNALEYNNCDLPINRIFEVSLSVDGAYHDIKEIIDAQENKDELKGCYMCDNDLIALGFLKAVLEAGYQVPRDIQICGFDDIPATQYVSPELTTVHVPTHQMGYMGALRLINILNGNISFPSILEISTTIVPRGSTL